MKENAGIAFSRFSYTTVAILIIALASAMLFIFRDRIKLKRASVLGPIALIVLAGATSFGYLNQYKSEFVGHSALLALRDEIETKSVYYAQKTGEIPISEVEKWITEFSKIMNTHAASYTNSFSLPSGNLVPGDP